jgi:hypothetical protein
MKVALLSASSVVLYAVLVRFTCVPLGLVLGTLFSILVSFTYAYFLHILLLKRIFRDSIFFLSHSYRNDFAGLVVAALID